MEYPYNLSKEEVIAKITGVHHAKYDLDNPNFDVYDQLLACEAVAESALNPDGSPYSSQQESTEKQNERVSVIGSGNGSYKSIVKSKLDWHNSGLIDQLKLCTSNTPRNEIANLLEEIFKPWPNNKEGHWLWVAQTYTARAISWVMSATVKKYLQSAIRKNPSAYFTYLLKHRKKRKEFRQTIDTH